MMDELRRCARAQWTAPHLLFATCAGTLAMWIGTDESTRWSSPTLRWLLPIGVLWTLWSASRHHALDRAHHIEPWLDQTRLAPSRITIQRFAGATSLGLTLVGLGTLGAAAHGASTWPLVPLWTAALAMGLWALAAWRHRADPDASITWRPCAVPLIATALVALIDFADQGHLARTWQLAPSQTPATLPSVTLASPTLNPQWREILALTAVALLLSALAGATRIAARATGPPIALIAWTLTLATGTVLIALDHPAQASLGIKAAPMLACAFTTASIVAYHCVALSPQRAPLPREDPSIAVTTTSIALACTTIGASYATPQWSTTENLWIATATLFMVRDVALGLWLRLRWPRHATIVWIGLVTLLWGASLGLEAVHGPASLASGTFALAWHPFGVRPDHDTMIVSCACALIQSIVALRMLPGAYRRARQPPLTITSIPRPQPNPAPAAH